MTPRQEFSVSWDDLKDDSIDDLAADLPADSVIRGPPVRWADLKDDSMDDLAANRPADSAIRDFSAVSELSTGVKRTSEIGCSSVRTDDGFDDGPLADAKRQKCGMGDCGNGMNVIDESSYQQPMSDASVVALANHLQTMVPVIVPIVPLVDVVASVPPQGFYLPSEAASFVQPPETIEKREKELENIRGEGEYSTDVIDATPLKSAADLQTLTKRPWEKAKEEYRGNLKVWSLKRQTEYSDDAIRRALEIVHKPKMKPKEHVELALAYLKKASQQALRLHS